MKRMPTLAGTLVLTTGLLTAGLAHAQDVRPPSDGTSGGGGLEGIEGGQIDLPEGAEVGQRQMRTTMDDQKQGASDAVDDETVQEVRKLAIEEFGQASSSQPADEAGPDEPPQGVEDSYKALRERARERGVKGPE